MVEKERIGRDCGRLVWEGLSCSLSKASYTVVRLGHSRETSERSLTIHSLGGTSMLSFLSHLVLKTEQSANEKVTLINETSNQLFV